MGVFLSTFRLGQRLTLTPVSAVATPLSGRGDAMCLTGELGPITRIGPQLVDVKAFASLPFTCALIVGNFYICSDLNVDEHAGDFVLKRGGRNARSRVRHHEGLNIRPRSWLRERCSRVRGGACMLFHTKMPADFGTRVNSFG